MTNSLSVDETLDQVFAKLGSLYAANLGTREFQIVEASGVVLSDFDSVFIPTTSPSDGALVSRVKNRIADVNAAQAQGGIAYTNIARLDNVSKPGGVERLFRYHASPAGPMAAILKVAGRTCHLTIEGKHELIETHLLEHPRFDIDAPLGAIVVDEGLNLNSQFCKLRVLREASYGPDVVSHLLSLINADLRELPAYEL